MAEGLKSPKVLTDADFVESTAGLVPRPLEPETYLVIIAHTNLYGTEPGEDEFDGWGGRDFLKMVLAVVDEFPEIRVSLLNHDDAPDAVRRLPFTMLDYDDNLRRRIPDFSHRPYAEALVCLHCNDWRQVKCIDHETPDSLRLWLRGILLAWGFRPTNSSDDLAVRLAYELAQPVRFIFDEARWDDPNFRYRVYKAAKLELDRLTEEWSYKSA